jgi:hypothetical protein
MRQYARQIDQALRPLLNGLDLPLILAAVEPMDSIYRSVNSYPHLLPASLPGNPDTSSDAELTERARRLLDDVYAAELRTLQELYTLRASQRRASTDIADVARAATYGLVDTVLVDIDEVVAGSVDEETGAITIDDTGDAINYGVVDRATRLAERRQGARRPERRHSRQRLRRSDPPVRALSPFGRTPLNDAIASRDVLVPAVILRRVDGLARG